MQRMNLEAQVRPTDKNTNQIRRDGLIPAVIYGHGKPAAVVVDAKQFNKAIHTKAGTNALFNVKSGASMDLAVIKEIQRDIFSRAPIHVDFQRINIKEKLELTIPVHVSGEAPGVKAGGVLEFITREIKIRCLPDDIPAGFDVEISNLALHHSIKVQDVPVPKGVEFITTGDHIIVTVVTPKVEEVAPVPGADAVAGTPAQPEVIAKGKKDEEGAPAAGGAAAAAPAAEKKGK